MKLKNILIILTFLIYFSNIASATQTDINVFLGILPIQNTSSAVPMTFDNPSFITNGLNNDHGDFHNTNKIYLNNSSYYEIIQSQNYTITNYSIQVFQNYGFNNTCGCFYTNSSVYFDTKNNNIYSNIFNNSTTSYPLNNYTKNIITNTRSKSMRVSLYAPFTEANELDVIEIEAWINNSFIYDYPENGSIIQSTSFPLEWQEGSANDTYTYQLASDGQFINIISVGSVLSDTKITTTLSPGTYYWHVKNSTSGYFSTQNFTISSVSSVPGQFNISVWDEQIITKQIINYTTYVSNSTTILTKTSNSANGWTNFSGLEVISGEYLVTVVPINDYNNYYQRMVLSTSPANVTMYVPNSTNNSINLVAFSLLDITGLFPFPSSTISIYKGGLLQDKSYFSADATHPVYLIQGTDYQINIQHDSNLFNYGNYIPYTSGTSQIVTSDFNPNASSINPFTFNISADQTEITLNWNDAHNALSSFNYTVHEGDPMVVLCNLVTSVKHGQSLCGINTSQQYHVIMSALLTDGTYKNYTTFIDYRVGARQTLTGVSTVDGSPTGIGFVWNYGTFTMPSWVYNWISVILIVVLAGSFGGFHSGFGAIILSIFTLLLEKIGWFRPIDNDTSQSLVMGLTVAFLVLSVVYYLQHKDRGG